MKPQWYIWKPTKTFGPYSTATLRRLAARGAVRPSDKVCPSGAVHWIDAGRIAGLFGGPLAMSGS